MLTYTHTQSAYQCIEINITQATSEFGQYYATWCLYISKKHLYKAGESWGVTCTGKERTVYFHVCDKSGLRCGLLINMLPYLPTAAITVSASKVGSMMCLLKQAKALPSTRPCRTQRT